MNKNVSLILFTKKLMMNIMNGSPKNKKQLNMKTRLAHFFSSPFLFHFEGADYIPYLNFRY